MSSLVYYYILVLCFRVFRNYQTNVKKIILPIQMFILIKVMLLILFQIIILIFLATISIYPKEGKDASSNTLGADSRPPRPPRPPRLSPLPPRASPFSLLRSLPTPLSLPPRPPRPPLPPPPPRFKSVKLNSMSTIFFWRCTRWG